MDALFYRSRMQSCALRFVFLFPAKSMHPKIDWLRTDKKRIAI
jgi:hypothetical protein